MSRSGGVSAAPPSLGVCPASEGSTLTSADDRAGLRLGTAVMHKRANTDFQAEFARIVAENR